jgi:uncharacterized membrane protein YdfJ with MMPL/SSD domain
LNQEFLEASSASGAQVTAGGGVNMFGHWRILITIAALFLAGIPSATSAGAAQGEKSTGVVPGTADSDRGDKEKKLTAARDAAKQLLLVMDADKSGKISKQEWMKFMEAEFDRLDTDHKGNWTYKS